MNPNAENNTPCIIELDSTYRCRYTNPYPGKFNVKQTAQRNQNKERDPVSNQSPLLFWRGANFPQCCLVEPTKPCTKDSCLIVTLTKSDSTPPSVNNELGYSSEATGLCIQAKGLNGESDQNSLHLHSNYYTGANLCILDPSGNILNRRKIISYKYLGSNNAYCIIDGAVPYPLESIGLIAILDPSDFTNINCPSIFCPKSPFLENHYTHLLDVDDNSVTNNTNIIYNHCNHQYRHLKSQSYLRNEHIVQIDTTGTEATSSSGPITDWNKSDVYSIRAKKPDYCGGIKGQDISGSNVIGDYQNNNTPLFLTTEELATLYPPKRLSGLDTKFNISGDETLYNRVFNLPYGTNTSFFNIDCYPVITTGANINAGKFLEIMNTRCIDLSGSPTNVYELEITDASGVGDVKSIITGTTSSTPFSKFTDFYRGCTLRFSVEDASENPVYDSPFYGAETAILEYDGSGSLDFTIYPPIKDPSFDTGTNTYKANLICNHTCFLPKLDKNKFTVNRPSDYREIISYVNVKGNFESIDVTKNPVQYTLKITEGFGSLQLLYNQDLAMMNFGLSDLYLQDLEVSGNISLNAISRVICFNKDNSTIVVTFHTPSENGFGTLGHEFTISSGKVKSSFNNKLGNQDLCLIKITDNFCARINNPNNIIGSTCNYEITLCNVVVPNIILDSFFGGRIAAYQYFYVVLSWKATEANISLLTNNKNVPEGCVFRVPVERQFVDETNKFFLSFTSRCPVYTKFNPVNGLSFSVVLPNGETFRNISPETFPPCIPNPLIQISASFMVKRLDRMGLESNIPSKYTSSIQNISNSRYGFN